MSADIIALQNTILRTVVGSQVHGLQVDGTDDRDEMGICIPPPTHVVGLSTFDQWTFRTQAEGQRSGPGDLDLVIYSLRKYMALALKGNPTILLPIFAPESSILVQDELGRQLRALVPTLLSIKSGWRFLGYLQAQRQRVLGERGQARLPKRPELVERHGFDTKYAGHMIRLGLQGIELIQTGRISLPMPQHHREYILQVRRGEIPLSEVLGEVGYQEQRLRELIEAGKSPLPPEPDYDRANQWLIYAHTRHWSDL